MTGSIAQSRQISATWAMSRGISPTKAPQIRRQSSSHRDDQDADRRIGPAVEPYQRFDLLVVAGSKGLVEAVGVEVPKPISATDSTDRILVNDPLKPRYCSPSTCRNMRRSTKLTRNSGICVKVVNLTFLKI